MVGPDRRPRKPVEDVRGIIKPNITVASPREVEGKQRPTAHLLECRVGCFLRRQADAPAGERPRAAANPTRAVPPLPFAAPDGLPASASRVLAKPGCSLGFARVRAHERGKQRTNGTSGWLLTRKSDGQKSNFKSSWEPTLLESTAKLTEVAYR